MKRNTTITRSIANPSRKSAPKPSLLGERGGTKPPRTSVKFSSMWDDLHAQGTKTVRNLVREAPAHEVGAMIEALMSSANAM